MYNKFSIEAFVGENKEKNEDVLAILIKFEGKEIMCPIVQCKGQKSKLNSIKEHIRIANSLIRQQIEEQIKATIPKIITV